MKNFLLGLLSRKFLLTLAGTLTFVANKQYVEAVVLMISYFGFNVAESFATGKSGGYILPSGSEKGMSQNVSSEVITGKVE